MKLASLKHGRDGKLIIANKELTQYIEASPVCETMQQALDDWETLSPKLEKLSHKLNAGEIPGKPLNAELCDAPLPRSYGWLDGSAYVKHVELVRKARGAELPESFWTDPLMYQGHSSFNPAHTPISARPEADGLDFEAEVAVILDDVPEGTSKEDALHHVKLITLINDMTLRGLTKPELSKGFGFINSKPPCSMSLVAITPDELGEHWRDGTITLPLTTTLNGNTFGNPMVSEDMTFTFADLIAHASQTRPLEAGTVIGSGTIANVGKNVGSSCIAEKRMLEVIENGFAQTPWLQKNDLVQINMLLNGQSILGKISQKIV
ncbi:MAG: fumarylacetoacetate hydrolase family protein [Alphaproteobacteria bacterium]|nr:fumarylacetoacetate hydrolase family protein [Alphaproteobacteria bacterium]